MPTMKFDDLNPSEKHAVFWLADQAETLTPHITAAASRVGEIWEAANFMHEYPKGSNPHMALASRLKLGDSSNESVMDCIKRAAPAYRSLAERADVELDELLSGLRNVATVA